MIFSPIAVNWVELLHPQLAQYVAIGYLLFACINLFTGARSHADVSVNVAIALCVDIAATTIALYAIKNPPTGIAMLLMVNVGAGALLLPPRLAGLFTALATIGVIGQSFVGRLIESEDRSLVEYGLYGFGYFATALLCFALGKQMRETEALAERRGIDLANLSQINELIIRRMKTGVMVVDDANRVHLWNESAWTLLGNPEPDQRDLGSLAPELSRRLYHWRRRARSTTPRSRLPRTSPRSSRVLPSSPRTTTAMC